MHERQQADFFGWGGFKKEGTTVQCGAKVRWKRDGYRTSPIQNRRWLWVFEFDPFHWENCGGFTYTDQRPFRGFATGTKKKKKRTFVVSGGGFVRTSFPQCTHELQTARGSFLLPSTTQVKLLGVIFRQTRQKLLNNNRVLVVIWSGIPCQGQQASQVRHIFVGRLIHTKHSLLKGTIGICL